MTTRYLLETLLNDLGLRVAILEPSRGYTVDSYPVRGQVKESELTKFSADIAGRLKSPARVAYNEQGVLAVELAAQTRKSVLLVDCGKPEPSLSLPLLLGKTNEGKTLWLDLAECPHLLIAGTTGSGKSNWLSASLTFLVQNVSPKALKLLAIDPKKVELTAFSDCPHLLHPIITDAKQAELAITWLVNEMQERYELLATKRLNNISQTSELPRIVLIIEELAQLLAMGDKEAIENNVQQLTQLARAVGIHVLLSTQKPSSAIFSSVIKANVPKRLAFKSLNHHESIAILEQSGSQDLLGKGDALLLDTVGLTRFQAPLTDPRDIEKAVKTHARVNPYITLAAAPSQEPTDSSPVESPQNTIEQAKTLALQQGRLTASLLIEHGICGKNKANLLMKELRTLNIIGAHDAKLGFSPTICELSHAA
jgi:DNA segregation ATPase FtsK/SpoIIIE, S-DNA-T family